MRPYFVRASAKTQNTDTMYKSISLKKLSERSPFWLVSGWSLLLLANFIPTFPQPAVIIGYLWKVEFALAALIFLTLALALKYTKDKKTAFTFGSQEIRWIIVPLFLFTMWSGLSCFRADSPRNALHHTLLWACFCIFYLLVRHIVSQPRLLDASLKCAGLVIAIIFFACLTEYLSSSNGVNNIFTYRYYKYAEALVTLLPVYLALTLQSKSRLSFFSGVIAVFVWLVVMLSLSRTEFIAGVICVFLFFTIILAFTKWKNFVKKSVLILGVFLFCAVATQTSILKPQDNSTVKRLTADEGNHSSLQWRFLVWGITLEAFKSKPTEGIGGDNFVTDYRTASENYAALNPENKLLELDGGMLAERSHNEFLQILAELGIVGAFFFGWFLFGIGRIAILISRKSVSVVSIASLAGIAAFLISSMTSSYSFRVPANGVCFFFVLALTANGLRQEKKSEEAKQFNFDFLKLKPIFVGLIICSAMLIFSAVRGVSLMYLQNSLSSSGESEAEQNIQKAIALDTQEALFRYYYGIQLLNRKRSEEAIPQMRFAIDHGIATTISYFNLASAQIIARQNNEAEQTLTEALRVYPRSVFLRTAYASFLTDNGNNLQAQIEYEKALQINPKQAASWQIAHTQGVTKLTQSSRENNNLVEVMSLMPTEGVYSLLDFQRQNNPGLVNR